MFIIQELTAYINYLERMQKLLQGRIDRLPAGEVVTKNSKGKKYYYLRQGNELVSLNRDKRKVAFVERLKLEKRLRVVEHNLPIIKTTVRRLKPAMDESALWEGFVDDSGDFLQEEKKHLYKGRYYRSKSEVIIAQMLMSYDLEFKYEAALKHNGRTLYPDFVVRRADGRVIIWEHFGMMENQIYRSKVYEKIEMYYDEGFYLWDNFVASFDETSGSINMDTVEKIIRIYLI